MILLDYSIVITNLQVLDDFRKSFSSIIMINEKGIKKYMTLTKNKQNLYNI